MTGKSGKPSTAGLGEARQVAAMRRYEVLRPHLDDAVPLSRTAAHADVPLRTIQRWLASYLRDGLVGLARSTRSDKGTRRLPNDLVTLVEGMGLKRPRLSAATVHRRVVKMAGEHGWPAPSYGTVYAILTRLDPAMVTLAHEGAVAFRDRFELIHRYRADKPNAIWQADHTLLDVLVLDPAGKPARPWLTVVIDDHSRAVAGYLVFLGAPSALNTSLALRQAIWRKPDPAWAVCGVPDALYVDHGSDFTSRHLERAAADLRIRLIHSAVARPQGRGKVERLFGTLNTELLPELPGHLTGGQAPSAPKLSLDELDQAVGAFIVHAYNRRVHQEIGQVPLDAWRKGAFLPRLPESLESLDLLLVHHAQPRRVRRDGIRFLGLRYAEPMLAAYVGEPVTIRYDPRDVAEVRVFHRDRFLCRAVSEEHAGEQLSLKDVEVARRARRRALRTGINERVARVAEFLPGHASRVQLSEPPKRSVRPKLRVYEADR